MERWQREIKDAFDRWIALGNRSYRTKLDAKLDLLGVCYSVVNLGEPYDRVFGYVDTLLREQFGEGRHHYGIG